MTDDRDCTEELEQAESRITQLENELYDLQGNELELADLQNFREQVREKVGLHWDARDDQILARVRGAD